MSALEGIRACVFDAYGTLFDFSSAVARERATLGDRARALDALWRRKQLEYTWLRTLMRRYADFRQVTEEALRWSMAALDLADEGLVTRLMRAYEVLAPYPEVAEVLTRLRAAGLRTAVLSNGTPAMLTAATRNAGLEGLLDAVWSVEEVRLYKPDPAVYELATRGFGLAAREIAFLSANAWDAHGAASFGLRVVWVNRSGQPREPLPGDPVAEVRDLTGLLPLLGLAA